MNKYGTCKWFGFDRDGDGMDDGGRGTYRPCGYVQMARKGCYIPDYVAYKKGSGALAEDASNYYAALVVEEDFGCVKWESK